MRHVEHVGVREAALLLFAILSTKVLLYYPSAMVGEGRGAGWLLVLLNAAWGLAAVLVFVGLVQARPGQGLNEMAQETLGPLLGTVFSLLLAGVLLAVAALTLRQLGEAFIVAILPQTPPSVLLITALLLAVYGSYLGLETIARVGAIVAIPATLSFLALLALVLPHGRPEWLFPLLGPGLPSLLAGSLGYIGEWLDVVLLGIYAYAFRSPAGFRRAGLLGTAAAALALAGTAAVHTMVFGPEGAVRQPLPLYHLARMIYLGRFLQRVESFFVLIWLLGGLAYTAVLLHATAVTTARALNAPYVRPLLFPLALLLLSVALLPPSYTHTLLWDRVVRTWGSAVAFGGPLLLLALGWWQRRRIRLKREVLPHVE